MIQMLKRCGSLVLVLSLALIATAQTATAPADPKIDAIVQGILKSTGVPSASVAIVKDGKIAYLQAYGDASLEPKTPATPAMRYSIGSNSKQFTTTAILLLQEQSKLSLDDKVAKFFPNLTRANEVSIRQLLSHTSGYQDYWPQDYVMPEMMQPTTAQHILDKWAKIPLDFDPGTKWQYSNTNYVIAGLIIEKAAGIPMLQFLTQKIFAPLGMQSVQNIDQEKLTASDPIGYMRYALGPLHPAPKEGKGWLYAAGELAMTAQDLAKWDIATIEQKVLRPESYHAMQTNTLLKNGVATGYGLGVSIGGGAHRSVSHGGEVSGFTSTNQIFPDDRAAVVVLTNQDAIGASGQIASRIAETLWSTPQLTVPKETEISKQIMVDLQKGKVDRSLFTDNANFYFNETCLKDNADSLGPLGTVTEFSQTGESLRGGMTYRGYRARMSGGKPLNISTFWMPDGKIEQYIVTGRE
jgi:CubicO group peptidase (beta-lactamase class C family)